MYSKSFNLKIETKIKPFNKFIKVDSDKSISIRSFLIGAISQNISSCSNILESEDVLSTINCLKKLGVKIVKENTGKYSIYGNGLGSLLFAGRKNLGWGAPMRHIQKFLPTPRKMAIFGPNYKPRKCAFWVHLSHLTISPQKVCYHTFVTM